jgi:hypothetical protein
LILLRIFAKRLRSSICVSVNPGCSQHSSSEYSGGTIVGIWPLLATVVFEEECCEHPGLTESQIDDLKRLANIRNNINVKTKIIEGKMNATK